MNDVKEMKGLKGMKDGKSRLRRFGAAACVAAALVLVARADVLLDTTHFGGGNTSYEALAFGTPIVTSAGRMLRDRITYACYQQMGISDCIAQTAQDYVRIAVELATEPTRRDRVRSLILARKHLLYEDAEAVRELEQFFLGAVARARSSATP